MSTLKQPCSATQPTSGFIEIRDRHTLKLVCRYNPETREIEVRGRSGDVRRGTLPEPSEQTPPVVVFDEVPA